MNSFTQNHFPPRIDDVLIYFQQKGVSAAEARDFFLFYESKNWRSKKGTPYKNWKVIAFSWVTSVQSLHTYSGKKGCS